MVLSPQDVSHLSPAVSKESQAISMGRGVVKGVVYHLRQGKRSSLFILRTHFANMYSFVRSTGQTASRKGENCTNQHTTTCEFLFTLSTNWLDLDLIMGHPTRHASALGWIYVMIFDS